VILDRHAHFFHVRCHASTHFVELILRGNGMIAAVQWDVMSVTADMTVPVGFAAFDGIAGTVDPIFEADAVEDVELELRPPAAFIGDARGLHVFLGADGNVARVIGEGLVRVGFERTADKAQGGRFPERVEEGCAKIRDKDHIPGFDRFQSHGGTVEADAFLHQLRFELTGGNGEVMSASPQVAKLQVDHFNAMFGNGLLCLFKILVHRNFLLK